MSYTELIIFEDGKPSKSVEYRNAWGGSARIWNALFDNYVPKKYEYDSWINTKDNRLWDLATNLNIPLSERAVHAFTFDNFYIRNEHFNKFVFDLRFFVEKYPTNAVDHLPSWADFLEKNNKIEAVGLYGTSVAENLWYRNKKCNCCKNTIDEIESVPLSEGIEVYDWLNNK